MTDADEAARIAAIADGLSDEQRKFVAVKPRQWASNPLHEELSGLGIAYPRTYDNRGRAKKPVFTPDGIAVAAMLTTEGEPTE